MKFRKLIIYNQNVGRCITIKIIHLYASYYHKQETMCELQYRIPIYWINIIDSTAYIHINDYVATYDRVKK